jgi:hypothetical protein
MNNPETSNDGDVIQKKEEKKQKADMNMEEDLTKKL